MNNSRILRTVVTLGGIATVASLVATPLFPMLSIPPVWQGYGGNPQHTGVSRFASKPMERVIWSTSVDEDLASSTSGSDVFIHYASPMITAKNTVVHPVKFTVAGDTNNWKVKGRAGATGAELWSFNTDYKAPIIWPTDWTTVYPVSLVGQSSVVMAGGGGTVWFLASADTGGTPVRMNWWGTVADYQASPSTYDAIRINTPITGDARGNFWFGYYVDPSKSSTLPSGLATKLGGGGIVMMNSAGTAVYRNARSIAPGTPANPPVAAIPGADRPAFNAAPALSNSGNSVYACIRSNIYSAPYLVKLSAFSLATQATVLLQDPYYAGTAKAINESSASPMVGPDGHVFYGVFGNQWRQSHGWMLQYDQNLKNTDANGKPFPVGAFGWDDTASIIPASSVKSYTGTSPYLLLTKYNNYYMGAGSSGNGDNHLAILDPRNNDVSHDLQTGIKVMNEIALIRGITCDSDFASCTGVPYPSTNPAIPVREWCINGAAIDPATRSAIINSEDGHSYRWDFDTNSLKEGLALQPATGEAYTCTVIGPDGTSYAINNGILHAVGPNVAASR